MELLAAHWHCILPLIGIAAYLLCTAKKPSRAENEDWDSKTQSTSKLR
jgi:hypothetical protein